MSMQPLDWLIVAPRHDDLEAVDAEIAAIAAHHNIIPDPPLEGYVTDMDVTRIVTQHECDVMHWITHTANGDLQLSDGMKVDADALAQFVLSCKAELCIIDACVGEHLAERVAYLCACDIIYSPVEIKDRDAAIYMAQYAAELAKTGDYYEAYQAAGSRGGQYKFIKASDSVTRGRTDHAAAITQLNSQLNQVKASVTTFAISLALAIALAAWVIISLNTLRQELTTQINELRAEMRYLERTIDRSDR